jgi:hypothetical protein
VDIAEAPVSGVLLLALFPVSTASDSADAPWIPESVLPIEGVGAGVPSSDAVALPRVGRALSLGANLVWPLSSSVESVVSSPEP